MTRFIRAQNTEVLRYLEPHLVEDPDYTKEGFLQYLGDLLVHDRQHTFVLTAFNDKDQLVGFIIAYAPQGMAFTFVYQAWYDQKKVSPDLARLALSKLKNWTDMLGRPRILAETRRNPEACLRKWGFKEVSKTLELKLYEEEIQDERWSKDGEHAEQESEGNRRSDQSVPEREDREDGRSILGAAGGSTAAPVRQDPAGNPELQRELPDAGSDGSSAISPERTSSSEPGPNDDSKVL